MRTPGRTRDPVGSYVVWLRLFAHNVPVSEPLIAVNFSSGSASATEILTAAGTRCHLLFLLTDPAVDPDLVAFLREVADVDDHRGADPATVARELRARGVAGTTTFSEGLIASTAEIAQAAGLTGFHAPGTAARLTDKALQRRTLHSAGSEHLAEEVCTEVEALAAATRIGYPVVFKPARGTGGAFTRAADQPATMVAAWHAAVGAGPGPWVVEQRLIGDVREVGEPWGPYVSVEAVSLRGRARVMAVSGKTVVDPPLRETGTFVPSTLDDTRRAEVEEVSTGALAALCVNVGVTHTEVMLTAGGPRVIEVNGRLGGKVGLTMRRAGLCDPVAAALAAATGDEDWLREVLSEAVEPACVAYDWMFNLPGEEPVRVAAIRGMEKVCAMSTVDGARLHVGTGDLVDPRLGSLSVLGHAFGATTDHAELARTVVRLRTALEVDTSPTCG
jgi:biotin carboxylase